MASFSDNSQKEGISFRKVKSFFGLPKRQARIDKRSGKGYFFTQSIDPWQEYMKTVITYGTYDLLHIGHINMLKRCRALGDRLIVALSTDEFNLKMKSKICVQHYPERKEILESLRCVDLVIPEENWEQKVTDVITYCADIFVIGDDWEGKFDFLKEQCQVVYLKRTPGISTTVRKNQIVQKFSMGTE